MIASVYIKDGKIHFYNEGNSLSNIGGIAYELARSLLNFVCYEQARFEDGFTAFANAFGDEYARVDITDSKLSAVIKELMTELG